MPRGSLSPFYCGFSLLFDVARWLRDGCKEAAFCEIVLLVEVEVGSVMSGEILRAGCEEAARRLRGSNCTRLHSAKLCLSSRRKLVLSLAVNISVFSACWEHDER